MKRKFTFDVRYEGEPAKAHIELEFENGNLSICGDLVQRNDMVMGGQCLDELKELIQDETFDKLYRLWKLYHLNDMHAGTVKQEEALREAGLTGWASNYSECCQYLDKVGLLIDDGYKFGTGWLKREIPEEDVKIIQSL